MRFPLICRYIPLAGVPHQVLQRHHRNRAANLLPDFWHHSCRRHRVVLSFSAVHVGFYSFRRQLSLRLSEDALWLSECWAHFHYTSTSVLLYRKTFYCYLCLLVYMFKMPCCSMCSGKYSIRLPHLSTTLSWLPFVKCWWLSFTCLQKNPCNHPVERGLLCFHMWVYGSLALSKCLSKWVSVLRGVLSRHGRIV